MGVGGLGDRGGRSFAQEKRWSHPINASVRKSVLAELECGPNVGHEVA